jgi:hypothetical protein
MRWSEDRQISLRGRRGARTKPKLPRAAVAALRERDLKSNLLKPGNRWLSARSNYGHFSRRGADDLVQILFDGTIREADSGDSLTTADAFATIRTPHPSILFIRIATRLVPDK